MQNYKHGNLKVKQDIQKNLRAKKIVILTAYKNTIISNSDDTPCTERGKKAESRMLFSWFQNELWKKNRSSLQRHDICRKLKKGLSQTP